MQSTLAFCASRRIMRYSSTFRHARNSNIKAQIASRQNIISAAASPCRVNLRTFASHVATFHPSLLDSCHDLNVDMTRRWSSSSSDPPRADETLKPDFKREPEPPLDVDKELLRYDYEEFEMKSDVKTEAVEETEPIVFERGNTGVFDLEELVAVLNEENARDVCAISVPRELHYVDYLVIATGRSTRHIKAMAEYIRWAYKQKRGESDAESVKIEGEQTKDWFALDLGNIAVHLFLKETRRKYDLEQLWTVGPEHDDKSREISGDANPGAFSLEGFSFDAELEKFRQLRNEQGGARGRDVRTDSTARIETVGSDDKIELTLGKHSNVSTQSGV